MQTHFSRRKFLKTTAVAAAGFTLAAHRLPEMPGPIDARRIGLQLYSVREDMAKDPVGSIRALSKMGYRLVEAYGFDAGKLFGMPYADFGKLLQDNGMKMASTHCATTLKYFDEGKRDITDAYKKIVDDAAGAGLKYLICPFMEVAERPQIDKMVQLFNAAGKYCRKAGIRFAYHNHDFEFTQKGDDGRLLIEWLLQEVDPGLMAMEMDLYWVNFAHYNPHDWFRLYPGRWELCHVKDLANSEKRETIEVGDGAINFRDIFAHSGQAGLKYYIIELEHYKTTPMQGVERARSGMLRLAAG